MRCKNRWKVKVLQKQLFALRVSTALSQNTCRILWTKNRRSTFWKEVVKANGEEFFKENCRLSRETFQKLCADLKGMTRRDTNNRQAIPLEKRIAIGVYEPGSSAEFRTVGNLFDVSVCIEF